MCFFELDLLKYSFGAVLYDIVELLKYCWWRYWTRPVRGHKTWLVPERWGWRQGDGRDCLHIWPRRPPPTCFFNLACLLNAAS